MKLKKVTFILLLLTVLCGCTAQPSNNTNNILKTKTYLYSYDYETEPDGELITAYHEEKPSVDLNESRDVVKATVNFRKNTVTYIKMNETYSKGNYECTVKEAYKTVSSDFFYTLVDEQYHEALAKEIAKRPYISKDTGKLIKPYDCFFCVKIHLKYTGSQPTTMEFNSAEFEKKLDSLLYSNGFLIFIDNALSNEKKDNLYLEPGKEYDLWLFYHISGNFSDKNIYYIQGDFQNYNDHDSYDGYLIELNDLTEID